MQPEKTLDLVRKIYAGALADSVSHLGRAGVLEQVTEAKRQEQLAGGKARAAQMGLVAPEEAFTRTVELFACADWKIEKDDAGFSAKAGRCTLCALAKRMGAASPCRIYCLDPIEGMVRGMEPEARFEVEKTLFESDGCSVRVTRGG